LGVAYNFAENEVYMIKKNKKNTDRLFCFFIFTPLKELETFGKNYKIKFSFRYV
jgi:hypothetical protein